MISEGTTPQADRRLREAYRARPRADESRAHPDEAAWEAFASGEMETETRRRLADHVVSCATCREIYDAVRVLIDGAPAIDREVTGARSAPGATASWRRYAPALAMAASLVVAVGAVTLYLSQRALTPAPIEAGAAPTPAAPVAAAATSEPTSPIVRLAMVAPDVQLPADLITTTRGPSAAGARAFLEEFGHAIAPYREGRYEEAARRLRILTPKHGHVAEVWFYLGVSQLFAGRPTDALDAFDRPGVAAAVGDDVQWQRAVALERLGRRAESDVILATLCGRDGPLRANACAVLTPDAPGPHRE